jgi:hypothetical protein
MNTQQLVQPNRVNLVERPNHEDPNMVPELARKAGVKENIPYQLHPPLTPTDRLLYAVLLELQRMNAKLGFGAVDEATPEEILSKAKHKGAVSPLPKTAR